MIDSLRTQKKVRKSILAIVGSGQSASNIFFKSEWLALQARSYQADESQCETLRGIYVGQRSSSVVHKQESMDKFEPFPHFATSALHVGQEPEQWKSRAVIPPISMSTTFKQFEPGKFAVGQI